MRILIDTNILFSAILFPDSRVSKTLLFIAQNHEMVLCDQSIWELRQIIKKKKPDKLPDMDVLLAEMSYELIPASHNADKLIRDATDQPILNAAIVSEVDIILTGDKDFLTLDLEHPLCLNVADYLKYEDIEL